MSDAAGGYMALLLETKGLATSDTPVVLRPSADHPAFLGVGIANAGEIHVPTLMTGAIFAEATIQGVSTTVRQC